MADVAKQAAIDSIATLQNAVDAANEHNPPLTVIPRASVEDQFTTIAIAVGQAEFDAITAIVRERQGWT